MKFLFKLIFELSLGKMFKNSMWVFCTGVFRVLWVMEFRVKVVRVGGEKGFRFGDR